MLARELKKLWNIKVTIISIGIGALWTVPNDLEKGTGDPRKNWNNNNDNNMHKAFYLREADCMYQEKKEDEDLVAFKIALMHRYNDIKKYRGRLITATRNNASIKRTKISRKQKWEEKQLNGHFKWQTSEVSLEKTWI